MAFVMLDSFESSQDETRMISSHQTGLDTRNGTYS